jgi:predicted RNA-binding Zn ribbon-like protein
MRRFDDTGLLALDLVNTWDPYLADPERLPNVETLRAFLREHGVSGRVDAPELERCKALRERLSDVMTAATGEELVVRLNRLVGEVAAGAEVVQRADGRWALAITQRAQSGVTERLATRAVLDLVDLVSDVGPERIRACRAAPCREVFVDTSRNGGRRYCSRRCANRVNAARHRRRHAATHR